MAKHNHVRHHRFPHLEKKPRPHVTTPSPLPPAKVTPAHLIDPLRVHPHTPSPGEPSKTKSETAARRAARARHTPERVSIHAMISAARYIPNLQGAFADAEAHRPVSFSRVLHGEIDLFTDD